MTALLSRRSPSTGLLPLAFASLALSSCRVGPDYVEPELQLPDAWQIDLRDEAEEEATGAEDYWTSFEDPVLEELIDRSSRGSLDLQVAVARLREAAAIRGISTSEWWPQVSGDGSYAVTSASENAQLFLPPGVDLDQNIATVGGSAFWEIDVWGRIARSVESADAGLQATLESYRDVLVILHAEVAVTYFEIRTLQYRLDFARGNSDAQEGTLGLTRTRFDTGISGELDLRQAELNLATTNSAIPSLEAAIAQQRNRLAVLLGEYPGAVNELLAEGQPLPEMPSALNIGLPADLIRQRPDVRQAERELAAQTALIGVATGELYPTFSLFGDLRLESLSTNDLFSSKSVSYGFGPQFSWNLFNAGRVRAQIEVEDARTEQALIGYERAVLLAVEEVESTLVGLVRERERRDFLAQAVEAAVRSVELVEIQYKTGLTNFQNVLDTQRSLFQQQDALAESEGEIVRLHVFLFRALGGGWRANAQPPEDGGTEPQRS